MAEKNNQKYSAALGKMLCDRLTEQPSISKVAQFFNVSSSAIFFWMRASAKDQSDDVPLDKSKWAITWPVVEGEDEPPPIFLHEGIIQSQRLWRAICESQLRAMIAEGGGFVRQVLDGSGKPAFEVDALKAAHALEYDDDLWELTYGKDARRDDLYARDERGALIPMKRAEPLPSATLIHLARSLFPTFDPATRTENNTTHKVEVLVLGDKTGKKPQSNLRDDLEAHLAHIRANPDRASARPTGPVAMIGHSNNDPPERVHAQRRRCARCSRRSSASLLCADADRAKACRTKLCAAE